MRRLLLVAALATLGACHLGVDGGIIQRKADRFGGSAGGHLGLGGAGDNRMLALDLDTRVDVGDQNSRLAFGTSLHGGLGVLGGYVVGGAGIWKAAVSSTHEATVVPTFELGVYIPLRQEPGAPPGKIGPGPISTHVYVGVRDDIDTDNYVTVFVGWSGFIVPGP